MEHNEASEQGQEQKRDGYAHRSGVEVATYFQHRVLAFAKRSTVDAVVLVQFDECALLVTISQGRVTRAVSLATLPPLQHWDFALKGNVAAWLRFWQPVPAPGSHDIFALTTSGDMVIEGNMHLFMTYLQYFKDLAAVGRQEQK